MKIFPYLLLITLSISTFSNEKTEIELNEIYSLTKTQPDSALTRAIDLKARSEKSDDSFGIIKTNFAIGYILDNKRSDFGKAIIYYLEAIRHAKEFTYEDQYEDLASLHKNCGVIFRKFKSYGLASEYYKEALIYAEFEKNFKQIHSVKYNTAGLLMDEKNYFQAINLLEELIDNSSSDSKNYWKYNNRLGLALYESGDYESAIESHKNSLQYSELSDKLRAYTIHNIGRCYSKLKDYDNAYTHYQEALKLKKELSDESVLFSTYNELGLLAYADGDIKLSLDYYNAAEKYVSGVMNLDHYGLFKSKADALFSLKKYEEAKKYEDIYAHHLNNYLEEQTEIQVTDKRYNMDLITKRYFDEIAKQERIASILFYSKTISGSLLALLLLTVGYNRYQQVRLRKSITQELINLKLVE